ncbi:MAG TPA: homoserine kinase [Eubacteriaceae bacterium]|jgi:homoserine kinase|nr:homoserine kinase [Eubacteriaceae bacterium]
MIRKTNFHKITVPATSANLGPGFDTFGLALGLYNNFIIGRSKEIILKGCEPKYQNKNNLVYSSALELFKIYYEDVSYFENLYIEFDTNIPTGRGLGSSASCITAGLIGANLILGEPFGKDELFQIACRLEGHPDNISPAFFGGMTVSTRTEKGYFYKKAFLSSDFKFHVLIPDFEVSTSKARSIISNSVSLEAASLNIANSSILLLSLISGDYEGVLIGSKDYIYEDQRKSLVENFDIIKSIILENGGLSCTFSGAGPALLCISKNDMLAVENIRKQLNLIDQNWTLLTLPIDHKGVSFEIL